MCDSGDYVLPAQAFFAGEPASRLLADVPPERAKLALLHPELELYWERLEPLGAQILTFQQLFNACNDDDWLSSRDLEWWETLFDLLYNRHVSAETIGEFPLLRCQDGKCRPLGCGVSLHSEEQPLPIRSDWPVAYFFDINLQRRLEQQKPIVWTWLKGVACLRSFSVQSYITDSLIEWMRTQSGEPATTSLVEATHFIAAKWQSFGK